MIKIAACQYHIEVLSGWDSYVKKITSLVNQAKNDGAQLLLLPEYAGLEVGGYHKTDEELYLALQPHIASYCELFKNLAQQHQMYIQSGTILVETSPGKYVNRAYFFGPYGNIGYQDKLQLTAFEKNTGIIEHSYNQTLFETNVGKIGIAICYDSEFPEIVRRLVLAGAWLILVPSYTSTLAGYHRVSLSSRARALENQCYVATAFAVGPVKLSEPVENTVGQTAIFGPVENSFSDNGIIVESNMNHVEMISAQLSSEKLAWIRKQGEVHNYEDVKHYDAIFKQPLSLMTL